MDILLETALTFPLRHLNSTKALELLTELLFQIQQKNAKQKYLMTLPRRDPENQKRRLRPHPLRREKEIKSLTESG